MGRGHQKITKNWSESNGEFFETPETDMTEQNNLIDLLVEYEEQCRLGNSPTVEQLCPQDASLQRKLRERIAKREKLRAFLDVTLPQSHETVFPEPALPRMDGFEVLGVLGKGGMGIVYKATQKGLNRPVAVKMILAGSHATAHEMNRFQAEAEAVAALKHPHIVQILQVGQQAGCPYLALEFVAGGSLAQQSTAGPVGRSEAALPGREAGPGRRSMPTRTASSIAT